MTDRPSRFDRPYLMTYNEICPQGEASLKAPRGPASASATGPGVCTWTLAPARVSWRPERSKVDVDIETGVGSVEVR